jgi:4-hydroxybenzoate polyprenyltransferase
MSDLKNKKARILYIISLACGIWFLAFGWAWTYLGNLIIAYPFGLIGFLLWLYAKKLDPEDRYNRICIRLLLTGLFLSIFSFFLYK